MRRAFTLIELLVVIAIIGVLLSVLIPALSEARQAAKSLLCRTRLRTVGQGLVLYANENKDVLVPARLPKINDYHWRLRVPGGIKYRPTFLTMMASQVGLPPFEDPQPSKKSIDKFGQPGDRQNYSNDAYLCPEVSDWTDERNACYGYNYQFLGNARLRDPNVRTSYKNWPVTSSSVRSPAQCVAAADSMGTAASFSRRDRTPYEDNKLNDSRSGRTITALGNEGFNLDPPRVDPVRGEMASLGDGHEARTALHERHKRKGNILWVDAHVSEETLESLNYRVGDDGVVGFDGNNRFFSIRNGDDVWTESGLERLGQGP
ncbi:MAG: type II secretion system protein [Planctomycetes bacterium]|nr:type II secretion system protein [Planctomycetota bacterium]